MAILNVSSFPIGVIINNLEEKKKCAQIADNLLMVMWLFQFLWFPNTIWTVQRAIKEYHATWSMMCASFI